MFRALAAWHWAFWSLAPAAVWAEVEVGAVPPLACRTNWFSLACHRPSPAAGFGGMPRGGRLRARGRPRQRNNREAVAPDPGGPGAGAVGDAAGRARGRLYFAAGARIGPRVLVGGEEAGPAGWPFRSCRRLVRVPG